MWKFFSHGKHGKKFETRLGILAKSLTNLNIEINWLYNIHKFKSKTHLLNENKY